jgi:two-component system response regulator HydG
MDMCAPPRPEADPESRLPEGVVSAGQEGAIDTTTTAWRPQLLVVDDEIPVLRVIERLARKVGFNVETCTSAPEARRVLMRRQTDFAMIDLRMPDGNGLDLLRQIKAGVPRCEVVLMTGFAAVDSAVEAIKLGAREYLTKPFDFERLRRMLVEIRDDLLRRAQQTVIESQAARELEFCGMVGRSPVMKEVFSLVQRLAPHARVVLINGETGTGKELAARAFHRTGPREAKAFVTVNCAAAPTTLFESELFGHVRGAFPGAVESKAGLFEVAQGGTLFLDEIGELPFELQAKLLRSLDSGEVQPVGSLMPRKVDVTVIAATTRDLRTEVAAGRFRGDLYYRLNVVGVTVPPLRDRREDIPYLAAAFIRDCSRRLKKPLTSMTPAAETLLLRAPWAGNVRELRNAIERACILVEGEMISERELTVELGTRPHAAGMPLVTDVPRHHDAGTGATLDEIERDHIVAALRQAGGDRMAAAKVLGISRRALHRRLERHRIVGDPPHSSTRRSTDG